MYMRVDEKFHESTFEKILTLFPRYNGISLNSGKSSMID